MHTLSYIIIDILTKIKFNVFWCVKNFFEVIKIGIFHIINTGLGVYDEVVYNIDRNIGKIAIL